MIPTYTTACEEVETAVEVSELEVAFAGTDVAFDTVAGKAVCVRMNTNPFSWLLTGICGCREGICGQRGA
jgi:hypothetical protein